MEEPRPISEQIEEIISQNLGIRIEVTLETVDGIDWTVVNQTDAVQFDPEERVQDCQIMDMDMEDIIFHFVERQRG